MNNAYIIAPTLTIGISVVAETFSDSLHRILSDYNSAPILRSDSAMRSTEPDRGDAVILFNRSDQNYEAAVIQFLEKSLRSGATVLPVATDKGERHPEQIQLPQRAQTDGGRPSWREYLLTSPYSLRDVERPRWWSWSLLARSQ